ISISHVGSTVMRSNSRELITDDVQLNQKLAPTNYYELPAGESMNGFAVYPLSLDEPDDVLELATVEIEVKAAAENYDPDTYEYKPLIGSHTKFDISMSADGEDKLVERGQFYEDREIGRASCRERVKKVVRAVYGKSKRKRTK